MQPYERFEVWKRAHRLALDVYRCTGGWPKDERFGLVAQIRRSVFSVPVNIVEGSARRGKPEFRKFLGYAFASLAEVGYTLRFARDLGYFTTEAWDQIEKAREDVSRLLFLLMRSMSDPT